tara:strand:- start:1950 stop:3233 length:1284 start_codon:yes stop_codon:yes gene_type:complete
MAHPFYGDYKKANYDVNKSLDAFIKQASALASNERNVTKQQRGAKERLEMELNSKEEMFDRTENRLDTALADAMKSSSVQRKVQLATNARAQELHPIEVDAARTDLAYDKAVFDYNVDNAKYSSLNIKNEYLDKEATKLGQSFIEKQESLFKNKGLFDETGNLNTDLEKVFQTYNEDQVDAKWEEFERQNEDAAKRMTKEGFIKKWDAMELRRTELQWENTARDLQAYGSRNGYKDDEIMDELSYKYGDQPWYDDFEAMMMSNPDTTYTKHSNTKGADFMITDEGTKISEQFAIGKTNSDGLTYNEEDMYDNLRLHYSHNASQKALNSIAKAFAQTDETIKGSITVDSKGHFRFEEVDVGPNDHFTGIPDRNGVVTWYQNGFGHSINGMSPAYDTINMIDTSESWGFGSTKGYFKDGKLVDSKYSIR